uniref:B box-type domain-containing protein n=1 Tax=Kalanchoe fedtschenkoi TaxID=63787 RepID=A0A7N0TX97_KALFE
MRIREMKIRCDVCNREDAAVFCSADEAALCEGCDRRVHGANKVAQKHERFSLVRPSSAADAPLCDICQERRALLFCQQDRAILCRECDYPIHMASEQTQKHSRFLLTGVKLTPLSSSPEDQISCEREREQSVSVSAEARVASCAKKRRHVDLRVESQATSFVEHGSGASRPASASSSISEYLETLPGWHVEDFFDHLHNPYYGFYNA